MSALTTVGYAAGASLPLLAGAVTAVIRPAPRKLVATALAFAAGALIAAVAYDLFEQSSRGGGAVRAGLGFAAGAIVFVLADTVLVRRSGAHPTGLALLAGVTLDGIPENTALGVSLNASGSLALLVAVFVSNYPEALAGAASMLDQGRSRRAVLLAWGGATVLLAAAVIVGRYAFAGASPEQLSLPLAFAAGAVLTSVIDTLAPEAFKDGGPLVALASAAGFVLAHQLSA